jgi:hypothetical protein
VVVNRRDFLLGPYSLVVFAGEASAQQLPRDFRTVAPNDAPYSPAERHMRLVELETDV